MKSPRGVPLMMLTRAELAAGYDVFDGFDARNRVRLKHVDHRVLFWRGDGLVVVVDPLIELVEHEQARSRPS